MLFNLTKTPYLIIETEERDVRSISLRPNFESAAAYANELLKKHCELIGYDTEYQDHRDAIQDDPKANDWASDIHLLDTSKLDDTKAWCDFDDINWDACIIPVASANVTLQMTVAINNNGETNECMLS